MKLAEVEIEVAASDSEEAVLVKIAAAGEEATSMQAAPILIQGAAPIFISAMAVAVAGKNIRTSW